MMADRDGKVPNRLEASDAENSDRGQPVLTGIILTGIISFGLA